MGWLAVLVLLNERHAWGEGNGVVGVGDRGSCQGGGPALAGRAFRETPLQREWGGGGARRGGSDHGGQVLFKVLKGVCHVRPPM